MKKHFSTIILILVFFLGFSVLLYPVVSDYINSFRQSRSVASYTEQMNHLSKQDYSKYMTAMQEYNQNLLKKEAVFYSGVPITENYQSLIGTTGGGMIGYVTVKKLRIQLPIYYGTAEAVLSAGAGHLEGSSIPIGGTGTHAVITGHRGLPSARLFTDMGLLEIGDTFTITILNETLVYEVDKISVVEPDDNQELMRDPNEDYVTLLTCTPYGINTHRLLIRGVRMIQEEPLQPVAVEHVQAEAGSDKSAAIVVIVILSLILIVLLVSDKKRKHL